VRAALSDRLAGVSLRTRLVVTLLALLLVSCTIIAAATTLELRHFLINRLDEQLRDAGDRYALTLEHPSDNDADNPFSAVAGQAGGTLGARVVNGSLTSIGVVPAGHDTAIVVSARSRAKIAALTAGGGPSTVALPGLGAYRIIVVRGSEGDLLVTGLPQHGVDETIDRLIAIDATVFVAALLLTGTVGAISVRLSLRPLTRVARTAREVADMPLASGAVALPKQPTSAASSGTEVGQLADAFDHMLEHVQIALTRRQASEDRLRQFVADASHELRTPLAVIRSHAEHAQRAGGAVSDDVETALQRITTESVRMAHLVDDLLLLARLDSGRPLAQEEVDLTRLVIDAVNDARVAATTHVWKLDLPEEPVVIAGDEHRLHQAVANLLANARTHTPAGTTVTTQILDSDHTSDVEVRVSDDGPGISSAVFPHIFERFVRADPGRGHAAASGGLGLPISEAIVNAHHGAIEVDSSPGGTRFTIRLPRSTGPATTRPCGA
jgi:two-component system OmpR family sensor kinase